MSAMKFQGTNSLQTREGRFIETVQAKLQGATGPIDASRIVANAMEVSQLSAEEAQKLGAAPRFAGAVDGRYLGAIQRAITAATGLSLEHAQRNTQTGLAQAIEALRQSAEGKPALEGALLPSESYVELQAQKLKNAKLLWVNDALLQEMGIDLDPNAVENATFESAFLDIFAYSIPREGVDDPGRFDATKKKTFKADKYGGEAVWGTEGSGRAMAAGLWQIKGGGDTGLSKQKIGDKLGGMPMNQGVTEAIFAEVNHHELPFGTRGRMLALISTETHNTDEDGTKVPRVIAIRQDPIRPAHYMLGEYDRTVDPNKERVRAAVAMIDRALPLDPEQKAELSTHAEIVKAGLDAYVERASEQYATAFVKRLYHGGTSPSNIQLDGGWLDYDSETAQPGYGKITTLYPEAPSREYHVIKTMNVQHFLEDVYAHTPGLEGTDASAALALWDRVMDKTITREFTKLAGFPPELVDQLAGTPKADALGEAIHQIATVPLGHNPRTIHVGTDMVGAKEMPERTSEYDISKILVALAATPNKKPATLDRAIRKLLPDAELRGMLTCAYAEFYPGLQSLAHKDGVDASSLRRYTILASDRKNKPMDQVYRPNLKQNIETLIRSFSDSKDPKEIRSFIDDTVLSSRRTWPEGRYQLVLEEKRDPESGGLVRNVFDARVGKSKMVAA